jgi:hypothetical protein
MNQSVSLIHKPIDELDLSGTFKQMASRQHFRTLQDMLNWPIPILLLHEGFTYHIYQEFAKFLKKNNMPVPVSNTTIFPTN